MKTQGFDVAAISSPGSELDQFGEQERVPVHAVSMPRQIAPLADLRAVARITSWLHQYRADIVHAHTPKGGLLGLISAALLRVPVRFYHMRGLPFVTAVGWQRQLLKWTERISCLLAHRILCVSRSLRDVAIAEGLCPASKIVVLHHGGNGIDARARFNPARAPSRLTVRQRYGIPDEALVIGFVGRLVRDKGLVELANAWHALRHRHAHLHLLMAGRFESRDPVPRDIVSRLQEDERVHLVGYADSAGLYPAMDLVVLPTYREGLPNVLLEAAAMELPTVATHIPGCVDAVADNATGTLVPVRDVARLTAAIERYVTDDDRRQAHGRAGRERVLRDFAPEAIWKALAHEYRRFTTDTDDAVSRKESRSRGLQLAVKHGFDRALALMALIPLSPLFALIAVLIKTDDGGPVFFVAERAGAGGRPFRVYKFRSMIPDADAHLDENGRPLKPRVTRVGKLLRRWSLDELPQLVNILRGEMSFVGPRPGLLEHYTRYTDQQRGRYAVKPGVTGLAQISGRNTLPWSQRIALDLEYIRNYRLWLDAKILWRTLLLVATGRNIVLDRNPEQVDDLGAARPQLEK